MSTINHIFISILPCYSLIEREADILVLRQNWSEYQIFDFQLHLLVAIIVLAE